MEKNEPLQYLFWYVSGAVTYAVLRYAVFYREHKNIFINILTSYVGLITVFSHQLRRAHELRVEWLRNSGLTEEEIEKKTHGAMMVIQEWESVSTAILINSLPKKYTKHFRKDS